VVVGCELFKEFCSKGSRKATAEGISNAKFIQANGITVLEHLISNTSLDHLFINFPDPWHKKRHHKRRVFTPTFFKMCRKKLTEQGKIHFISDNREIYAFALENAQKTFLGKDGFAVTEKAIPDWFPRSKYHEKWSKMDRVITYFEVGRREETEKKAATA